VAITPASDSSTYGPISYDAGTLVIKGAQLTVTASGGSITAGDPFTPTASVSGLAAGDSASVSSVTFTYSGIGSTSYGPSSAVPSAAGAYAVTPSAATVAITPPSHQSSYPTPYAYVSGTLVVSPAPAVIPVSAPKAPKAPPRTMSVSPFAEGSYALTARLRAQILKIAKAIKTAGYKTVSLTGYTDNVFTPAFNALLELNRARTVSLQLSVDLTRLHVSGVVVSVVPAPSIVLVATNATARGRAANRRVVATLRSS
jgi:outer membrane protein OmpA-like peptidoglycan-associated protein